MRLGQRRRFQYRLIELSLKEESSRVVLRIEDQGEGVPRETLAKLTAPFFRVTKRQDTGVGLGLSVVQHVVKAHGGTLGFENLEPTGFAVTVTLPRDAL